jgi:hypothetical protein
MTKNLLCLLSILTPLSSHGNALSLEHFFSTEKFKGGVRCAAVASNDDSYLNEPTTVFAEANVKSQLLSPRKLRVSCAQGGGDCECVVLYKTVSRTDGARSFFQVKAEDGGDVWVAAPNSAAISIDVLATEAKSGEIDFRAPAPPIYLDKKRSNQISKTQVFEVPKRLSKRKTLKYTKEDFLITHLGSEIVDGMQMTQLRVELVTSKDIEAIDDIVKHVKDVRKWEASLPRYQLRTIWVPTFDSEGRINFWISEPPGC